MKTFGDALRTFLAPVGSKNVSGTVECGADASSNYLDLELPSGSVLNGVQTREDLSVSGQVVEAYSLEVRMYYIQCVDANREWERQCA